MTTVYGAALLVTWKSAWRQAQVNPRDGVYVVMLLGDTPHDRYISI
jgi:hypothetical protein